MTTCKTSRFLEPEYTGAGEMFRSMRHQRTSTLRTELFPLSNGTVLHIGNPKLSQAVIAEPFSGKSFVLAPSLPLSSTIRVDYERPNAGDKIRPWRWDIPELNFEKPLCSSRSSHTDSTTANRFQSTRENQDDQYHPGGVSSPAGEIVHSNLDIFGFKPATINRNNGSHSHSPALDFFQGRDTRGSGVEALFSSAHDQIFAAPAERTVPRHVEPDGGPGQLTDFTNHSILHQNSSSVLRPNYRIQSEQQCGLSFPFCEASQMMNFMESQAAQGGTMEESILSDSLQKPSFDLLSFMASNVSGGVNQSFDDCNRTSRTQNNSHSIVDSLASIAQPTKTPELTTIPLVRTQLTNTTPLINPAQSTIQKELPESDANENSTSLDLFQNWGNDFLRHENISPDKPVYEMNGSSPQSSSSYSNRSSQFSSPSLSSSSSSNKSYSDYSPYYHSIDSNNFEESYSVVKNSTNSLAQDVGNQYPSHQGSLEEFLNTGEYLNSLELLSKGSLPHLESVLPLQHQTNQQQSQLQQFWPQAPHLQHTNLLFSAGNLNGVPENCLKTAFICPKCGKGHTRQSNLLAHLRDTHSDVKKVFCDVPGCTKSYKRVSECRRHKKDFHGIPLPSELSGKIRKPRSTTSSIRPKYKHLPQIWK